MLALGMDRERGEGREVRREEEGKKWERKERGERKGGRKLKFVWK